MVGMILDDRGLPWTIRLSLGWTIVLALFSAGFLYLPLGIYLAYWVRTRQGRSAVFWCYLVVAMIEILALLAPKTLLYIWTQSRQVVSFCLWWLPTSSELKSSRFIYGLGASASQ